MNKGQIDEMKWKEEKDKRDKALKGKLEKQKVGDLKAKQK